MSSSAPKFVPGDVVRTSYGAGVLISCPSAETEADSSTSLPSFVVRIWRVPGKSIGSSSLAYIQAKEILGSLPVAPGMVARTVDSDGQEEWLVHCYSDHRNVFLVSPLDDGDVVAARQTLSPKPSSEADVHDDSPQTEPEWREFSPEQLQKAPSAKFYPLLHELMKRGDMTASVTTALMQNEKVNETVSTLVKKSTELSSSTVSTEQVTSSVQSVIPKENDVKQVYSMLKDEELTVLLEKGRDRLKQLVDKDVPQATELALKQTGIIIVNDDGHSFSESITKSRETALRALEELMKDVDLDSNEIRGQLEEHFTTMFDSLSQAAKSDRALSSIFDTISGKTFEWQEATGRLLSTKSACLFMEGASRLQARAANLFSKDQMQWAGEVGSKFTKSFTEGDAAVARLKSIELGDAVRSRLVTAIEVRSESHGGLDGIIAGALSTMGGSGEDMQRMLASLETTASTATKDAHETLISVLSKRSQYRDLVLCRIEKVLCELESYLGDDMSPEDIALVARGEGGTSALFEPIARRAAKEISKQLDVAEANVTDPTILGVLQHVRKIISGELTAAGLLNEVVSILNDDKIVAAGESLMKHGESVLDAIEGVSGNKVVDDVMQIAEKAGITKDSVMSHMEALDVDQILDTAGNAVTDEKARQQLVSSATDVALDFILRILPSMPVPPFDGVKDGLLYHLSNLSMQGFKVKKENIMVEVAGMRATKKAPNKMSSFDYSDEALEAMGVSRDEYDAAIEADDSDELPEVLVSPVSVKATELLIIDVREISAVLDNAMWSFEQTYMPYLKGSGMANVRLSDGSIRLQFELRKQKKMIEGDEAGNFEWEPVLCLHDRSCSIEEIELVLQGESRLTWIVNKLAAIFRNPLRDYVVRTIINVLTNKSGWILQQMNSNLSPYWGLILRTAGLTMDDLVEADHNVVTASQSVEADNLVELVWRQNLPLGMNLLLNDDSGLMKVVDFPRGSQARSVCLDKQLDPVAFNGATIVAVNGSYYDTRDELYEALKDPGRPKSILFELAESEDAERVKQFVQGSHRRSRRKSSLSEAGDEDRESTFMLRSATFTEEGELGIQFASAIDDYGLVVHDYLAGEDDIVLAAERHSEVQCGDLLTHVNGEIALGANGTGRQRALSLLESIGNARPLTLSFIEPYLIREVFEKPKDEVVEIGGPEEFVLAEKQLPSGAKRVYVKSFEEVPGAPEAGGILIGDHLAFINGVPVGVGCRFFGLEASPELHEVYDMLRDPTSYPIGLTFARPNQGGGGHSMWGKGSTPTTTFDVESCETIAIAAESFGELGCVFETKEVSDVVLTDLFAVPGPFQKQMEPYKDSNGKVHLSIEAVNGQITPSYATADMVKNALRRSWKSSGNIEITFLDDERKEFVHNLT